MSFDQSLQQWIQVNYSEQNKNAPIERWGHQIVQRKNHEQIYLFGGYGSHNTDGRYFNDLWIFSTQQYRWTQIKATGQLPETKSNYSLHYNEISDEILLFGGGSDKKVRFNSVFVLNCKTKHWSKYIPEASQQAPWERTYHASQFVFPYLIIHGGESVSNLDLDDTWVFNVVTKKWRLIQFEVESIIPLRRRFHGSFIWNNYFYIVGGCNHHYSLIGDAFRVNLRSLFQKQQYSGFNWQCISQYNSLLQRWGHTCSVVNGKVYINYGRISLFADSNDTILFDLENHQIKMLHVSKQNIPKPRRRHSSVVINDCILIFGGYNGKYLNDFHFLKIENQEQNIKSTINVQLSSTIHNLQQKITQLQSRMSTNITIKLTSNGRYVQSIKSNEKALKSNLFFKHVINYSSKDNIKFQMPQYCTVLIYRIINICLNYNLLLIPEIKNIEFYRKILQSCDYLNCGYIQDAIQNELVRNINEDNYQFAFNLGIQLNLQRLVNKAAYIYIENQCQVPPQSIGFEKQALGNQSKLSCLGQDEEGKSYELINMKRKEAIDQAYKKKKFIIQQAKLKQLNTHFLLKTVRKIKQMFTIYPTKQSNRTSSLIAQQKKNKEGCVSRMINCFYKMCSSSKHQQNQQEQ